MAIDISFAALHDLIGLFDVLRSGDYGLAATMADRLGSERFEITRSWTQEPYLTRWVLSDKRFEGDETAFLHRFQRSDSDEMHDHPFAFTSLILAGGYWEKTPATDWSNGSGPTKQKWHDVGSVLRRPAEWIHSVILPNGEEAWTLFLRGHKTRHWGFWCPEIGFRPWHEHEAAAKVTGKGCA